MPGSPTVSKRLGQAKQDGGNGKTTGRVNERTDRIAWEIIDAPAMSDFSTRPPRLGS